jgi:hypothetical protein
MLFLLFLLNIVNIAAQSSYSVNCGQLALEIVPQAYNGSNDGSNCYPANCCAGNITCDRIEYEVFLRANDTSPGSIDLPNSGNFYLSYSELYVSLNLLRGINSVISTIDPGGTEYCLSSDLASIPDGSFETDVDEDEVTLHISSNAGDTTPLIQFQNF